MAHNAALCTRLGSSTLKIRQPIAGVGSLTISAGLCSIVCFILILSCPNAIHWFLLPVFLGGILITSDGLDWFRGKLDVFDPVGLVGLYGIHFFFIAPLFHVYLNYWMDYVTPPPDWREWLGRMALLNLIGLIAYRHSISYVGKQSGGGNIVQPKFSIDRKNSLRYWLVFLLVTGLLQLFVYLHVGGISGYISAFEALDDTFVGMGWIFVISESFPVLFFIGYAIIYCRHEKTQSWITIFSVLAIFLVLKLLFGGFRGSRSSIIFGLFWALGIVHFWIRPVPRKIIYVGLAFVISFMYVYGFYKSAGLKGFEDFTNRESRLKMESMTDRTLEGTILGDFGRSDTQAFLLYRLSNDDSYEYALGKTYLASVALLIPKSIWPERPEGKVQSGTELQYGNGLYPLWRSSRVYGLSGEAMLNFGILPIPVFFWLFGMLVAAVRNWIVKSHPRDILLLMAPFAVNLCIVTLASDSDNILLFIIQNGFIPFIFIKIIQKKCVRHNSDYAPSTCPGRKILAPKRCS